MWAGQMGVVIPWGMYVGSLVGRGRGYVGQMGVEVRGFTGLFSLQVLDGFEYSMGHICWLALRGW